MWGVSRWLVFLVKFFEIFRMPEKQVLTAAFFKMVMRALPVARVSPSVDMRYFHLFQVDSDQSDMCTEIVSPFL